MHRALVLVLAVLAIPTGAAAVAGFSAGADLPGDERATWRLEGGDGDAQILKWAATMPIDVLVLQAEDGTVLDGNATPVAAAQLLNTTSGRAHVALSGAGPWILVLDNTDRPVGGAPGMESVHADVSVSPYEAAISMPPVGPPVRVGEEPTLWNTLMFDSHHWETGGPIEFASVGLWMVLLFAVACIGFASPLRNLGFLAACAAAFVMLWALVPRIGELTEIGPPALAGLGLAWMAVKRTSTSRDSLQLAFAAAVIGAFAGVLLAFGLRHLWADPSTLYLGGRRFTDVLFTLPGFAVAGVVLFKVIPDIVHAIDDANADDTQVTQSTPGQGDVFHVRCLRCQTEIKVDRSMKRFRVATDRFEFACPNCQYWMEWADPAQGAAAA
ncbi:MAG: hypothetical protein WC876_08130 [Candidatus Thermoplasmatota archaeon]|jgi:hypothetical protein